MSISLTNRHAIKIYGGVKVWLHALLTSALDVDELSASRSDHFSPSPVKETEWTPEPVWTRWRRENNPC
jgi:hypothetical protein